jgi:hypothetical protein
MNDQDRQLALEYFKSKDPNLQRVGCPDKAVLRQLAMGRLQASSSWYSHLRNCAACASEAEEYRRQSRMKRNMLAVGAAAAALLIATVLVGRYQLATVAKQEQPDARQSAKSTAQQESATATPKPAAQVETASNAVPAPRNTAEDHEAPAPRRTNQTPKQQAILIASLDYRSFAPTRGDTDAKPPTPKAVRANGMVEIVLPIASATGRYEVQIVDQQSLQVRARTNGGMATLRPSGETVLALECDLRSLRAGTYSVALRPTKGQWSVFPIQIN